MKFIILPSGILLLFALLLAQTALVSASPESSKIAFQNSSTIASSRFDPLFEDNFEDSIPLDIAFNGSLPLNAPPSEGPSWSQMDVDAILTINETYPNGNIWGRSRIWIVNDQTKAHQGNNSAKLWAGSWTGSFSPEKALQIFGSQTVYCLMMKRWLNELPQLYIRWYQKFDSLPSNDYITVFYLLGMKPTETGWSTYIESGTLSIRNSGDSYWIDFSKLWGTSAVSVPVNLTTNKWYCFEVWYKSGSTDGEYKLWLDGEPILSLTGLNVTPSSEGETLPTGFDLGLRYRSNQINNITTWIDDVVAADYRVGPIGWESPPVNIVMKILEGKTEKPVDDALVQLGPYQGYTNESGFVNFGEVKSISSYMLNISKFRYHPFLETINVFDLDMNLEFHTDYIPEGKGSLEIHTYEGNKSISSIVSIPYEGGINSYISPFSIDLDAKTYVLTAYYGNKMVNETVSVIEGILVIKNIEFPIDNCTLEIYAYRESEDVASEVKISGNNGLLRIFETPVSVELMPGTYRLEVTYGNRTLVRTETMEEGQKVSITFNFEPENEPENTFIKDIGLVILIVAAIAGIVILVKIH
jgi:hypothetical protein